MVEKHTPTPEYRPPESLMADFLSADELHRMVTQHDVEAIAEKEDMKHKRELELQRRMDMFSQKRELTPEVVERAIQRWQNAAKQGANEVEVMRFPSKLCTDSGRAINNGEVDWGQTLVGVPAQVYELWSKHLQSRGYRLKAYIVDFPDGKPGDVGMFISWG